MIYSSIIQESSGKINSENDKSEISATFLFFYKIS